MHAGNDKLEKRISKITQHMKATVGVSVWNRNGESVLEVNPQKAFIMQSVFKLPLAIATLHFVEKGQLTLQQKIEIPERLLTKFNNSKLKNDHPEMKPKVSVSDLVMYSISYSDNLACDVLFELVGGCKVVDDYMHQLGYNNMHIKYNEQEMYANHRYQTYNCTTPNSITKLLYALSTGKILKKPLQEKLMQDLLINYTSEKRIKGLLPKQVLVAHKTGTGYCSKMVDASNDVGILMLPDGNVIYLSVFVMNAQETENDCEKYIAKIAWEVYKHFSIK
jgi:beta-lactamase class A